METLSIFHIKILQILASRYDMGCTFDELISFLTPVIHTLTAGKYDTSTENEKQARVLDALIALNDWGHIF